MIKTEFMANRNAEIYDKFCKGAKQKALGIEYDLSESFIKQICLKERRLRGLVKERGKRQ